MAPTDTHPNTPPAAEPPEHAAPPAVPAAHQPPELPQQPTPPMPSRAPAASAAQEPPAQAAPPQAAPPPSDLESTTQIRAVPRHAAPPAQATPPVDSEGATQLLPPVTDAADTTATQPTPAVHLGGPPADPESTTQIRAVRPGPHTGPGGLGGGTSQAARAWGSAPTRGRGGPRHGVRPETGVESTQALPGINAQNGPGGPGGAGDFDSLFRSAAHHTPQDHTAPPPPSRHGHGSRRADDGPARRRFPVALVLAVVLTSALVGLIAGAVLNSGSGSEGSDTSEQADSGGGSAAGGAGESEGSGGAPADDEEKKEESDDAARQQAEDLSTLLEDSNNSRDAVISAVEDVRSCSRLAAAARDLRSAADQRERLVERLGELDLDQLPDGDSLAEALTEAWEASAEADDRYADWADDAREDRREVCRRGQARHTDSATEGDQASGTATQAKENAADLWNPIAREYGLPERTASQL
jgi:hypothetical protein